MSDKKVIIVTGAARGIGKEIALRLAREGNLAIGFDNDLTSLEAAAAELKDVSIVYKNVDVSAENAVRKAIEEIDREYGRLDAIVNNAGYGSGRPFEEMTVAEFDRIIAVNLKAAFMLAKFALPLLRSSVEAAIVNIASTRALMSEPGDEAYAASKAGLLGLTHALANSLGPKVRVNAICPGWIDVSGVADNLSMQDHLQHPVGRVGKASDVAAMTAFLLSEEASFITGQSFVVDGGMTKKMIYHD